MQIRTKITLYFVLITASLLFFAFLLIYSISSKNRDDEFEKRLKIRTMNSANVFFKVDEMDSLLMKKIDINRRELFNLKNLFILNGHRKILYSRHSNIDIHTLIPNTDQFIAAIQKKSTAMLDVRDLKVMGFAYKHHGHNYYLVVCANDRYGLLYLKDLKNILIFVYLVLLSFLGISGWLFSKKVMEPISSIMNQVEVISGTNLSFRLNKKNKRDEISRLIVTFNDMLERIEKAFNSQKMFSSNAAHEIGNPLASITTQIEVALLSVKSTDEYKLVLQSILEDIRKLNDISAQLLLLSKTNERDKEFAFQRIRIDELIWDVRQAYLSAEPEAIIQVELINLPEAENALFIQGNHTLLKTCFYNLIDNGIKYSHDKQMSIKLDIQPDKLQLSFENAGDEIHEKDLPFLFDPFFRSNVDKQTKGFGIGLSLVKQIADYHNIEIIVEANEGINRFMLLLKKEF